VGTPVPTGSHRRDSAIVPTKTADPWFESVPKVCRKRAEGVPWRGEMRLLCVRRARKIEIGTPGKLGVLYRPKVLVSTSCRGCSCSPTAAEARIATLSRHRSGLLPKYSRHAAACHGAWGAEVGTGGCVDLVPVLRSDVAGLPIDSPRQHWRQLLRGGVACRAAAPALPADRLCQPASPRDHDPGGKVGRAVVGHTRERRREEADLDVLAFTSMSSVQPGQ
jgi:hypothetical protein